MYGLTPFGRNGYDLFDMFDNFDRDFFPRHPAGNCRTDIKDEGDKYVLESELPGFEKEDISLDINGSYLVISAQHKTEDEKKDDSGKYIRRERTFGSYKRSFGISGIDTENISAEYKNGILIVDMPKKKREEPETRKLEIK
ncbi:MAG: Hsp20/alpha crystallin family protein [Ruminococcus sp.]|nr:Hsp20/alpha crystallin family protein [Ruminococcus sp.]